MPLFTVLTPLNHNGHHYAPGAVVAVAEQQAAALLRVAALDHPPLYGTGIKFCAESLEPAVETTLATAIPRLNPTDPSQWTRDGRPRTEALAAIIGRRVSANERNRIWRQWLKEKPFS
jgi:hypothetical protein